MSLWGGVFNEPSDDELRRLNDSLPFDQRMYREDIAGSIAYAQALADAGVIRAEEAAQIQAGLGAVLAEFEAGAFVYQAGDEDIHTAVERRLTELIGTVGGKLHTGRSRNDQVATDFRLWTRAALQRVDALVRGVMTALIDQAEHHAATLMPGYTHLQAAQPVTAGHWLMSYVWMLQRDRERLASTQARMNVLPLGAGALAGNPFPIQRAALASALGFTSYSQNSMDAVSDRDFVADALYTLAMLGVHLSRLAEDVVLFSNSAFGFIRLPDRYSTGSSLMPQKRNPDPLELARGKAGRLIGNLMQLLTVLKGLPSGYNKDLQEDKEALFDSVDALERLLPVLTAFIHTMRLNVERMAAALTEELLATDLADYLVRKGMPFREAHHVVGRVVRLAADTGVRLSQVPLENLQELSELFSADVTQVWDFAASVARRSVAGGTAPESVRAQIEQARRSLADA